MKRQIRLPHVIALLVLVLTLGTRAWGEESLESWIDQWKETKKGAQDDGLIPGSLQWAKKTGLTTEKTDEKEQVPQEAIQPRVVTTEFEKDGQSVTATTTMDPDGRRADKFQYEDGKSFERLFDLYGPDGPVMRIVECDSEGVVTLMQITNYNTKAQITEVRYWYPEGTTTTEYRDGQPFKVITRTPKGEIVKTLMS